MLARIRKGDLVKVISGKHKGKTGRVLRLVSKGERVIIEGVNLVKVNKKSNDPNNKGTQETREASIHISNVQPVDPSTAQHVGSKEQKKLVRGVRVGVQVLPDGRKVRVARGRRSSGEIIDSAK